ncbi:Slc25a23 [Symbiodinium natans]|uniref:Slc25a23 protein n=1 Tax=Symbiodinium natans TaxID=878477 RepID=A0A812P3T2_9DINO|nr:Slc25a23 [Symbiodinium natans]
MLPLSNLFTNYPNCCPKQRPGIVCTPCGEINQTVGRGPFSRYGKQRAMRLQGAAAAGVAGAAYGYGQGGYGNGGNGGYGNGGYGNGGYGNGGYGCSAALSIRAGVGPPYPGPDGCDGQLPGVCAITSSPRLSAEPVGVRAGQCEVSSPPCIKGQYVDYNALKQLIKAGCTQEDFQKLYDRELAKVSANLSAGDALSRDAKYAVINRQALDKISKKFDKRLNGQIRAANWVTTSAELAKALGGLQIEDAFNPPDLEPAERKSSSTGALIFCAGAFSGIMSRTLTAPLDRIKIMMQAGNAPKIGSHRPGHRWDARSPKLRAAARAILRDGGPGAFWQGNGANVLKVMPESAVKFLVYDKVKSAVAHTETLLPVSERLVAGSVAGCISQAVVYPLDVTKTRLAAAPAGTYSGILDCIQRTVALEGFRALYKGIGSALLAIVPAAGIDLAVYNTLKVNYEQPRSGERRAMPLALALCFGAASATSGAVVAYPLTVVRTRLIVQGMPGRPPRYKGVVDCIRKIWVNSGPAGLYRGLTPALFKTIPAVSIGWAAFEFAKRVADSFL